MLASSKKVKSLFRIVLLYCLTSLLFSQKLCAQNISNEGTDFWVCFPSHVPSVASITQGYRYATLSVFITSKSNSRGKVSCGTFFKNFNVAANTVIEVEVPRDASYIENGTGIYNDKGIRVKVDDGQPQVVVYAHVFAGARSAASLVLPVEALGDKYYAIAYNQSPTVQKADGLGSINVFSQFNIVATEPNTAVKVTPVIGGQKQRPLAVMLDNVGDVYQYQDQKDVTGSIIEVDQSISPCKKVAVFSGSSAVVIMPNCNPASNPSSDPLFQQLYPIESWGKSYALIPFYDRREGNMYRFMAKENGTIVNYNSTNISLNEGEYKTFGPIYRPDIVKANKPITIAQYALTQYCSDVRNQQGNLSAVPSDPDMVILNPLEYSIDAITLYSSTKLDIEEQYINVTIPTSKTHTFRLNNTNYGNRFTPIPGNADFSYAQIALHTIGGSNFNLVADTGFNAVAYGFGAHESYAYSAGTNLASTKTINALKQGTDLVIRNACVTDAFDFKLILPYEALKIVWKIDADAEIEMPVLNPKQIQSGDRTLYEYRLTANKVFTSSGVKKIEVRAVPPPSSNVCSVTDEDIVNYDLEINALPVADFTYPLTACSGNKVQFNYKELNIGKRVISWLWDFGDGTTSTERDPQHIYSQKGTYIAKLIINNEPGCVSDVKEQEIQITERFTVNVEMPSAACEKVEVAFADKTVYPDGLSKTWHWDFGDNTTSSIENPTHIYQNKGLYTVSLTVTNASGCAEIYQQQITVNEPPHISFDNEQSCVSDVLSFNAKVLSGEVASWEWDFGDGSNDLAQKYKEKPQYRYSATGNYLVKLKGISPQGCITVYEKEVLISGANPSPSFEVLNANALCGDYAVQFKNTSTISFGVITKLEWMFDYGNGQQVTIVDTAPDEDKIYEHKYPESGQDKTYRVVLRAYSGTICYQESNPVNVTVKGVPTLFFNVDKPICINAGPLRLDAGNKVTLAGTEKVEGQGLIDGVFYPEVAGVGNHEITYTFLSSAGCTDTIKRVLQVLDIPELEAYQEFNILLGGQRVLDLKLQKGKGVKYQWYPSEGLSADNVLNPVATPKETTKYMLTLTSGDECLVAYEVMVNVHIDPFIPNAFSPNGDGYNDIWSIKYLETFINADIKIFNRYGQEVFYSKRYTDAWNGKYKGQDVPVGVYYYIIEPNNGRNKYTGSITLIR